MKAIFITNRKILPLNDGAFIYTYGILEYLKERGMETSLVSFYEKEDYTDSEKRLLAKVCETVDSVKLRFKSTALNFSFLYPNNIRKYTRDSMMKLLKQKITNNYEIVIIDHLHMFEYARLFKDKKIVLIEHNIEYKVWENYASKCAGIFKYFVKRNAELLKNYEIKAVQSSDAVVCIAENDALQLKKITDQKNIVVMPPYNKYDILKKEKDILVSTNTLIFIGSFGWYPNQKAAHYLACEVMPRLREFNPKIKLYLVGKEPTREIMNYANTNEDIIVTGKVESVDPYIKKADIFVNAMFDGGGMNIKMMEAMAKGIPILTTDFGKRGIGIADGREALIFRDTAECVSKIQLLLEDRTLALNISRAAREYYEHFVEPNKKVFEVFFMNNKR